MHRIQSIEIQKKIQKCKNLYIIATCQSDSESPRSNTQRRTRILKELINFPITSRHFIGSPRKLSSNSRHETFSKITRPSPIVRQRDVRFLSRAACLPQKRKECRKFRRNFSSKSENASYPTAKRGERAKRREHRRRLSHERKKRGRGFKGSSLPIRNSSTPTTDAS